MAEPKPVSPETRNFLLSAGTGTLDWCMQCGFCTAVCPWRLAGGRLGTYFNIRRIQRLAQLGVEGFDDEEALFACTTCALCEAHCPRRVEIVANIRALRGILVEAGFVPQHLDPIISSLYANGNPWSGPRARRLDWARDLRLPRFERDTEYLLFVCCTSCYDPRSQRIARSVVRLLDSAGVSFGVIGTEESCCGDVADKVGAGEAFRQLALSNIRLFQSKGVRRIITTSPHCFVAFRDRYPALGGEFEVFHYTEVLLERVRHGALGFARRLSERVAYHDPCYLGRHGGVFDAPRELLGVVLTAPLVELAWVREVSHCCGSGGGRLWAETPKGERLGELRVSDALARGARVLTTACPYCVMTLEADCFGLGQQENLQILELGELLASCCI